MLVMGKFTAILGLILTVSDVTTLELMLATGKFTYLLELQVQRQSLRALLEIHV